MKQIKTVSCQNAHRITYFHLMAAAIKSILIPVIAISVFTGCKKTDNNKIQNPVALPKLVKVLDTLVTSQKEYRTFYFYAANGNCDSIVYENQTGTPPNAVWPRNRLRFIYNNDSLPIQAYFKPQNSAEYLYATMEYNNAGKIKKIINFTDTLKYSYDMNNRLVSDSQFNRFGVWQNSHLYSYDAGGNVINFHYIYPSTPPSLPEIYAFDTSPNPFHKPWSFQPGPISVSVNNITSQGSPTSPLPIWTTTYQYNSYNLPVKSYLYMNGQPGVIRTKTYFYQ